MDGPHALALGVAAVVDLAPELALGISTAVVGTGLIVALVRALRIEVAFDAGTSTLTARNLFGEVTIRVRDVVAVRIVEFPWVRSRGRSLGTCPMIELRSREGRDVRVLATAISSKKGRQSALDFLVRAGIAHLPTRSEYAGREYVARQWDPVTPTDRRIRRPSR